MLRPSLLTVFVLSLSLTLHADQAAYLAESQAEAAVKLLTAGSEVRHLCEPCGEEVPRAETVEDTKVRYTGSESFYEVLLNGTPVDLAYLYVEIEGAWKNLAAHLGLDVSDVSLTLDLEAGHAGELQDSSGVPDFPLAHYAGSVGGRAVIATLGKSGAHLGGEYEYEHIGTSLVVGGSIDADRNVKLEEDYEEDVTGRFSGSLSADAATFEGAWSNPDGSRVLPFSLRRIALVVQEEGSVETLGQACTLHLDYPVFSATSHPSAELLNAAVQVLAGERRMAFLQHFLEGATEPGQTFTPGEESPMMRQDFSFGSCQIEIFSEPLISLVFMEYTYTGGAHGMSSSVVLNLAKSAGKLVPLQLQDLFTEPAEALKVLSSAIIENLKAQEAAWVVDGQTSSFSFEDLAAFTISGQGLRFYFDPYAVGPYAQGHFEAVVPLEAVHKFIKASALPASLLPRK